ncbi:cadmium, cobalt and zinc/H(+)-K(+) antiporter [Alicyclobacillus cellulosilyticus]|uniref:Cadmium, cobalt and zinc/H(+)-K(+) antiporter n=1 Tax=Alicyclobacillus cellulosilyticus TaxID=1003997 RepID=A0A917K6A4_9BACL|nr:cation diffusion facilitator family transporter [Alicyclobacillus cellulosilyticus]GGJ00639.1 cadmium, cobalt and zinc/H(+)-K(+) antiporter [Alicyclobacillus cellulosilyticus]
MGRTRHPRQGEQAHANREPQGNDRVQPHLHGHPHDHPHGADVFHTHAPAGKMRQAFFITLLILAVEVTGGWLAHSLALWSDAGHVLTDLAAIALAWYATSLSRRPADRRMTFGYHRSGILAALLNGLVLWAVAGVLLAEAYRRLLHPQPVHSAVLFASAAIGLVLNLYLGLGLRHHPNLNVQSAVLHILGDAAASAGVIAGGIVMACTGWMWVDPLLTVLIALLIAFGAWRIIKQTVSILMEGTPHGIEVDQVVRTIRSVAGIRDVHDVHIWSITSGRNALSCHIVIDGDKTIRESQEILRRLEHELVHLGIGHVTIQTEDGDHPHEDSLFCCDTQAAHAASPASARRPG